MQKEHRNKQRSSYDSHDDGENEQPFDKLVQVVNEAGELFRGVHDNRACRTMSAT